MDCGADDAHPAARPPTWPAPELARTRTRPPPVAAHPFGRPFTMNIQSDTRPARRDRLALHSRRRLIAATAAGLALAACQTTTTPPDPPPQTPAEVSTAPSQASAMPSPGRLYQGTNKPCDLVDHQLLAQLFGPDITDVTPPQYTRNTILTTMACHRSYGHRGAGATVVPVRIQLADPAAIKAQYEGLRRLIEGRTSVTNVPGLGQSAYTYLDKSLGAQLALYDTNAYLTIGAVPLTRSTQPDARIQTVLIQVALKILRTLRTRQP